MKNSDGIIPAMAAGDGGHVVIALVGTVQGDGRRYIFHEHGRTAGQESAGAGFRVTAPTWAGRPEAGFNEVTAVIANARDVGAGKMSVMAHSLSNDLADGDARQQPDGTFDTLMQCASADDRGLPMTRSRKLFACNRGDRLASGQASAFEKSVEPKRMA